MMTARSPHGIAQAEGARWRKFLPAVATARGGRVGFDINVTAREFGSAIVWRVLFENGARLDGTTSTADCTEVWRGEVAGSWITRRRFELPADLPPGYHEFEARIAGGDADHCRLIVSPPKCFEPEAIAAGRRLWGIAVQLYTVRSRSNWGIGDFGDLEMLIRWVAKSGAGFLGLNPLHALAPADPARASPYSASSRHFLNVLYIAVPAVPEFEQCRAARERLAEPETVNRLNALRAQQHVDYRGRREFEIGDSCAAVPGFSRQAPGDCAAAAPAVILRSWPSAVRRCNCMRDSMRWIATFAPPRTARRGG